MNDDTLKNPAYRSLSDQQLAEIDELCDRFDQELVNGDDPRIETFLTRVPEAAQERLLAELLAMELEYRAQQGENLEQEEYFQRFPQRGGVIAGLFARDVATQVPGSDSSSIQDENPPELANFRLIKEIGRGGMGVVWMAEQDKPVKRRVALKLIKSELRSKNVLARFDAEKQALAMMEHQNIARVLDAGTTDDGRPYFVMEYVDGIPITQYCDDNKLSVDERLKLFVLVCRAVQHAHQKGIIHRDLKPSNVLVATTDGEAVPKVIDFGLAKAVEQNLQLSDVTMQTEFGKVVGTVQYMSPEQAELKDMDAADVDTRTDVYSLGVMLYELLAGSTPLDQETLGRNALLKVLELIREVDPPRPSNRLSSASNEVNSAVSDLRRMHPARLQQLLRGELDWVVMKALEKDAARRYQTADDFAQDLTNYLKGDTVRARPPSTWYQIQKFARRNRGLVAAMLVIGFALLAGVAGTTYGLLLANEKTELAEEEKGKAQQNEERAIEAESLAEVEAERARESEATAKFQLANARWDANRARDARDLLREIPTEYRDNFEWHLCNRKFDGSDITCYGHTHGVRGIAFSPDGTLVATASQDSSIKLWDANTGQAAKTLRGHKGYVDQVVFSPDGTFLASRSNDRTIKIWDVRSGELTATLEGHQNYIAEITFSPDGKELLSASSNATIRRWNAMTGNEIAKLVKSERGEGVAFSPDGKRFLTRSRSAFIIWDLADGQEIARQASTIGSLKQAVFSPDGRHIAISGHDIVELWDAELKQKIWTANGNAGWIRGLSFSPDGTRLASTGGSDRYVRVWDVNSGSEIMTLVGHGDAVNAVAFSPDGTRLASAGKDTTLKLWDARTGQKPMFIRAHDAKIYGLAFSNDGKRIASVGKDGKCKLSDVSTGRVIQTVDGFYNASSPGTNCVAFSPNDAYIAFGCNDNTVKLLNGRTGVELKSLEGHESTICAVAFSPDSKRVISGGLDETVKLWEIDSGQEMTELKRHTGRVNGVAFSPDGTRVVSACEDLTIKLWNAQSGQELLSLGGHNYNVADVVFSPDGKQIVTSSSDRTIRIWDAQSGEEISRMETHVAGVMGVKLSPDGKRIVSTGYDRMLKLWDTQKSREVSTLEKSPHGFQGVAFSPNGRRIAAGMDNGVIKFIDAPIESEVTTLSGHTDTVIDFSFSDNGSMIYSESMKEKLVWDLATRKRDPNATWEPPTSPSHVSPDGRWLISGDRNHLLLIDLEYKNTPTEKAYRSVKTRFDSQWHLDQAATAFTAKEWYAATFHFAVLKKNDPNQVSFDDGLQASFQELKMQFDREERDLEPHLATVVKESFKLPPPKVLPNPSFERPEIGAGKVKMSSALPGWKTTGSIFEIWSSGFMGVEAHDGNQFVEINAREEATLYKDLVGIEKDAEIEFSFAHRGRNGDDIMKLTITDLGPDNIDGSEDDEELFTKEYTTGKSAWAVYDSTTEPTIKAQGNNVRFAYTAVYATGGRGPDKTEGNFLDAANFGVGAVSLK